MRRSQQRRRWARRRGAVLSIAVAAILGSLSGCGNGLARVSGKVTLDGQPLRGGDGVRATVVFQRADGTGVPAVGNVDGAGSYRLSSGSQEGVSPGDYVITCTASQKIPAKEPNGTPVGRRITDPKFADAATSGMRFTVEPGDNVFDIELVSP